MTEPLKKSELDKLLRWRSEFQQDFRTHQVWYKQKRTWEQFYDGEQLSQEEKNALKARNQPEVVVNLIKPRIDGAVGDFLGRRVMMRARDRGTADFDKAKYVTEALRYVEDQNEFDEQEEDFAEDLFKGGVAWYKTSLEFDFLEPEIKISFRDNDDIILDRRARRRDLLDAKRLYETVWVEVEDLVELYPQHEDYIREAAQKEKESFENGGLPFQTDKHIGDDYQFSDNVSPDSGIDFETFIDPERRRIRLINIWERVQKRIEFAYHPDLKGGVVEVSELEGEDVKALKANFPGVQMFARTRWELNSGIFIANKILEEKENVRAHDSKGKFPFARAVAHVKKGDQKIPYGLVRQYIDPQKEYNKRRSKMLHKSNVNRILAEEGAFPKSDVERVRKEAARPDGVLLFKAGKQMNIDKDDPSQTDVYLLQLSRNEINDVGIQGEFLGTEDKVLSGRAIGLRQASGQKMLRKFYSALRAARRDIFSIALEEMQQYWTSEKLIKITDDPNAEQVVLNQRTKDPITGEPVILNNLRLGKYDIKIDEDVETPNQRQENFQWLVQLSDAVLKSGQPFPVEELIQASDMPGKSDLVEKIRNEKQRQMLIAQAALLQAGAGQNGQNVTPT